MSLLPQNYEKEFGREKKLRLLIGAMLLLCFLAILGIIFMLPSYFVLVFSKDDVSRQLKAEEEVFGKKETAALKSEIASVNGLVLSFQTNESRRFALSPLLLKLGENTPPGIRLTFVDLEKDDSGNFTMSLQGEAATRDLLLAYVDALKKVGAFSDVNSPIANLLKETKVPFQLGVKINPNFYKL